MNDGTGLNQMFMLDVLLKLEGQGYGSFFTQPRDVIYLTTHPQTRMTQGTTSIGAIEDSSEYSAGVMCSFAVVMGYPCIDGEREGQKHVWGYDPLAMRQTRAYDVPYNTNTVSLPWSYGRLVLGVGADFGKSGQFGSTFWNNLTGNGGATDPRGAMLALQTSPTSTNGFQTVRIFWNSGSSTVGIECDANTKMIGIACDDPATGAPPVTAAHLLDNVTVANSGSGGAAVVTLATQQFIWNGAEVTAANCPTGQTVTIPGAGSSVTVPGYGSYVAPDIDTVASCGTNQLNMTNAAGTTLSAVQEFVFYGNPVITSGAITDPGDGSGNERIHFEVNGQNLIVWIGKQSNQLYNGKIMRPRARFQPIIYSGGNRPGGLLFWGDQISGGTTFTISTPQPNLTDFTDDDEVGPGTNPPFSNNGYIASESGDGYAHPTTRFARQVIGPLYAAQDFALGKGGLQIPATGNLTIDNCMVGTINVNSSSAATITLPAWCENPIKVVDAGGHAGTATITISLANNGTVSGSATITSAFNKRTVDYTGNGAAVSQ